tara:strand:- start:983 stop:1129 length:147 start_codon:yes stop_codon:yes gene_type:complete
MFVIPTGNAVRHGKELPQQILDDNAKLKVYQENRDHKKDKEKKDKAEV